MQNYSFLFYFIEDRHNLHPVRVERGKLTVGNRILLSDYISCVKELFIVNGILFIATSLSKDS